MNERFVQRNLPARSLPGGSLHFWTDVLERYDEILELIAEHTPLVGPLEVAERQAEHDLDYRTHFERRMRLTDKPSTAPSSARELKRCNCHHAPRLVESASEFPSASQATFLPTKLSPRALSAYAAKRIHVPASPQRASPIDTPFPPGIK